MFMLKKLKSFFTETDFGVCAALFDKRWLYVVIVVSPVLNHEGTFHAISNFTQNLCQVNFICFLGENMKYLCWLNLTSKQKTGS